MKSRGKSLIKLFYLALIILATSCTTKQVITPSENEEVVKAISKYSTDTELEIQTADSVSISGTLTYAGSDKLSIIIAGSGAVDRNFKPYNSYLMLADSLKQLGISCFRYDKRGIGLSTKENALNFDFDDYVNDANSIVEFFKEDFDHINVIGHSEGGLIGCIISQTNPNVKSFVNLCGMSISMDSIILNQLKGRFDKKPELFDELKLHFEELRAGKSLSEVDPNLQFIINPGLAKFLTSVIRYNPSAEQGKVTIPVFVIGGSCDIQVPEVHAKKLFASVTPSQKNKYLMITGMGHVLKRNQPDCSDAMFSYSEPTKQLHGELTTSIVEFINSASKQETQDP